MFKVECLGCQAPYQVDERRVPDKGLKMRCPKCGTSFKVDAPASGTPQTPGALTASSGAVEPSPEAVGLPAPAASPFVSGGVEPQRKLGKAPGSVRDPMARTMIGVSAADLDLVQSVGTKPKSFRIPRPAGPPGEESTSQAGPLLDLDLERAAVKAPDPPLASGSPPERSFGFVAPAQLDAEDASLPVVAAVRQITSFPEVGETHAVLPSAPPASDGDWLPSSTASEPAPESLVEPSTPLRLSELPQPILGGSSDAPAGRGDESDARASGASEPELTDLPVASPVRRPPPRRARSPQSPAKDAPADVLDLPARLEDLDAGLPSAVRSRAQGAEPRRAAPARARSSLDELDLPTVAKPAVAPGIVGLPAPAAGRERAARPGVPTRRDVPIQAALRDAELPSVARGAPLPGSAQPLPGVTDLPEVFAAGLPEIGASGLPDVLTAGLPDVLSAGLPDVLTAGLPDVLSAGLPDVPSAGLPVVSDVALPEVSGRGVVGFGRVDLPVAREAGLPEVSAALPGLAEMDLPGIGEALPSLAYGSSWEEGNLPLVGESLPAAKARGLNPEAALPPAFADGLPSAAPRALVDFGPDSDSDPFAGSEAEFGSLSQPGDLFGDETPAVFGSGDEEFGSASSPLGARAVASGYGEVDVGAELSGGELSLETNDDMEFSAVPQRSSAPPGRPAASATVHDAADADATGSTLELGPERGGGRRVRNRNLAALLALCAAAIGGGALALKPGVGPFGIHFIVDQVKRGEYEQLLTKLNADVRRSAAHDTLDAARSALAALDAARPLAPRFEPLQARIAAANYDTALRFGPLPRLEALGKVALEQLDPESAAAGHRLARALYLASTSKPEARRELEALGADVEARHSLGELLLRDAQWPEALSLWTELVQALPDSPRAAFGLARAQLGAGQVSAAQAQAKRVLELNPEHVGAPILLLEAHRAQQNDSVEASPEVAQSQDLQAAVVRALTSASPGEAALAHSVLGELHLSQGRHAPAQQAFEESLAVDRSFPRALIGLGETLHISGRHTEALARFEAAARVAPGSLPAQLGIAKSQIQLAHLPEAQAVLKGLAEAHEGNPEVLFWTAKAEQALGAHDAALATYRDAIKAGKGRADSIDPYLALAQLQAELGQMALAQQTLSEARAKLPPSGPLHKALGEIAMNRAEYSEAYAQFQKALALDSGDTRARFMGAVALTRLGKFEAALSAFQSVGETDRDFPGLAVERGRLFEESGRNEEALREYEAAFSKSPEDPELKIRVGCGRVVAGRSASAEALLEEVIKIRPRSAEAFYCLGRALFEQRRYVDASTRLERALMLDPSQAVYHLYAGWVAGEVGRHSDAENALEKALELDKGLADAYWLRGRLFAKQGAVKDAISDLQHALKLKPSRHEALADLADALSDGGRMPKALSTWEQAIAADPDNPTWHFRYGKLLSSAGNGPQAAAHLKRAVDIVKEVAASSKAEPPVWLWQAHYLLGRELGRVAAAIPHWQAYLRLSPADDPYRSEAQVALAALGQPWERR